MNLSPVYYLLGLLILALGVVMAVTGLADALYQMSLPVDERRPMADAFLLSAAISTFLGGALAFANRQPELALDTRLAFLLTVLVWVGVTAFSALPFVFGMQVSYTDAFFEAMSGLTTTGSTIFAGLDTMPPAILAWRAILQGIGGMGIIVMAMAILPFLNIAGMQLFHTESSDKSDKVMPRPQQVAAAIVYVYFGLVSACAVVFVLTGMSPFNAVCHAIAAISTGGYSTSDFSFMKESAGAQWAGTIFMALGGMPFTLFIKAAQGQRMALLRDSQVRTYLGVLGVASLALAASVAAGGASARSLGVLDAADPDAPVAFADALRHAAFNVVSVVTTTGFASADYNLWGPFAAMTIFILTFMGACSGSTAGGVKIFRFEVVWIALRGQINQLIHPHAVVPRSYNGQRLTEQVVASIIMFIAIYVLTVGAIAIALGLSGLDFITAVTGAATAVGNVGPGLGTIIGPAGNFQPLPDAAKWLCSLGMLLGRLELMTVFVLLAPRFWRS